MGIASKALFFLDLLKSRAIGRDFPLTVIFNVISRCNATCEYCYAKYYARERDELDKEQIFSLVGGLVSLGIRRISFSGGEPLLRQDIGEIITHIKTKGVDGTLNTNGEIIDGNCVLNTEIAMLL